MEQNANQPLFSRRSETGLSDSMALGLFGLAVTAFHLLTNGQYGFHRDELDILMNAQNLAWGYVAYPPLPPFLARISYEVFGFSLVGMRLFPALAQGMVAWLVGGMGRDLGGSRWAQLLAAAGAVIAPIALTAGMLIQYMSFDYLWWVLLAFFVVRLLKTGNAHWWLGAGAAIGLGMLTKYTIAFFVAGLAAGILLTSARRYLASPWLWAGAGVALLLFLPNLLWQMQNDFISLEFLAAIHERDIQWGRTDEFLPEQLYVAANPGLLPLWVAGLYYVLFHPNGRNFRPLGWMYLVTFALMLVTRGRGYYLSPAYAMLLAAGAVFFEQRLKRGKAQIEPSATRGVVVALGLSAATAILLSKPVVPVASPVWDVVIQVNNNNAEMIGWPDLVEQVAEVAAGIPRDELPRTAILAGNYGEAGALAFYADGYDLPPVISGSNSLWERGYGDPAPETVIAVGIDRGYLNRFFERCEYAGALSNRYGVENEESTLHKELFICREAHRSWPEMWQDMHWFQ
jgi:hypothetical protein